MRWMELMHLVRLRKWDLEDRVAARKEAAEKLVKATNKVREETEKQTCCAVYQQKNYQ